MCLVTASDSRVYVISLTRLIVLCILRRNSSFFHLQHITPGSTRQAILRRGRRPRHSLLPQDLGLCVASPFSPTSPPLLGHPTAVKCSEQLPSLTTTCFPPRPKCLLPVRASRAGAVGIPHPACLQFVLIRISSLQLPCRCS